jgi:DNA processing protein
MQANLQIATAADTEHVESAQVTDPSQNCLADWLRLALTVGIGPVSAQVLLDAFTLPATVFAASEGALSEHVSVALAKRLLADDPVRSAAVENALLWAAEPNCHIIPIVDTRYPMALREIYDPPTLLYVRGKVELLQRLQIAVVGSRSASISGLETARAFAQSFVASGWCVTSGLALGIDAAAHEGALDTVNGDGSLGATIAVLGTGADLIYPARHQALAKKIAEHGCIISELPLGTRATVHNFPQRNRLIAGLSQGTLVVEAAIQSGSLITARLAAEFGREVFAIPGSIHSPTARGCHRLIRDGAKLVETADDVLSELSRFTHQFVATAHPFAQQDLLTEQAFEIDETTSIVLRWLGFDPIGIEQLCERSGQSAAIWLQELLCLELEGTVVKLLDGRYQRVR